ncbi:hypothetical protein [Niabella sp.]|uniref:hypothetical protein n=1 Tax=Niabella sp. TaxID=1962976 RepID=UPI0026069489|nr:hypothetical protein [Niabella sp.]
MSNRNWSKALICALLLLSAAYTDAQPALWKKLVNEDFGTGTADPSTTPAALIAPGTTSYTPQTTRSTLADGRYAVALNTSGYGYFGYPTSTLNNLWQTGGDHTGSGYMMMINANPAKQGEANGAYYLYSSSAFDIPGAYYRISFWAANLMDYTTGTKYPGVFKDGYIGLSVRNTPNNTGTIYNTTGAPQTWVLPRATANNGLPWQQQNVNFILPASYNAPALYFNFFNSDNNASTFGNDLAIDDILIEMGVVTVSGKIFNDVNGNKIQDTGEPGINGTAPVMYAYLTKSNGTIISKTPIAADGTYTFTGNNGVPYTTVDIGMKITYSTADIAVGGTINTPTPPAGYAIIGENVNGATQASAGPDDGIITLGITNTDMSNLNFAIEQAPESYDVTKNITGAPVAGVPVSLADAPLKGSDPIVQPTTINWTGKPLYISTLPTNGFNLIYNGHTITAADVAGNGYLIPNYDPSKLVMMATAATPGGTNKSTFTYAVVDIAGIKDPTPATFTLQYSQALPVVFGKLSATISGNQLSVSWSTLMEKNNDHFVIEVSKDGQHFTAIGQVASTVNGNSDQETHYSYTISMAGTQALGISFLAFSMALLLFRRRNCRLQLMVLVMGLGLAMPSCKKEGPAIDQAGNAPLFVRIQQVNKDGSVAYSPVVKAVTE